VHQLVPVCSCCLLDDILSAERHHKKMKAEAFIHQHQRVSFVDAYSYINGWPPVSDENICKTCTNLLESAYVFRQMCRAANHPIYNVCHCCLQEKSDSNDQFLNMICAKFVYNNKKVTFLEGYLDVNNYSLENSTNFTNSDVSVCEDCAMQLESAYMFRKMCQKLTEITLLDHVPNLNENKKYFCEDCDAVFSSLSALSKHKEKDHFKLTFQCQKCPKIYLFKRSLVRHIRSEHLNIPVVVRKHAQLNKSLNIVFHCEKCSNVYYCKNTFINHYRSKHLNILRACPECDKIFTTAGGLSHHKSSIHAKILHQCEQCSKTFYRKTNLQDHIRNVHQKEQLCCQDCDKMFTSRSGLALHKKSIHLKVVHQCEQCPKIFSQNASLQEHVQTKHQNKQYFCKECGKVLTTRGGLDSHIASIHFKIVHKCEICPKTFTRKTWLQEHVRKKH
jgi:hypothetical protein